MTVSRSHEDEAWLGIGGPAPQALAPEVGPAPCVHPHRTVGTPRAFEALLLLALGLLTLEAMLQAYPALRPFPERDSGVFLYTGWRILAGEVPYRDV